MIATWCRSGGPLAWPSSWARLTAYVIVCVEVNMDCAAITRPGITRVPAENQSHGGVPEPV